MALVHDMEPVHKLDILWPRVVMWPSSVANCMCLVRSSVESEHALDKVLRQAEIPWDVFSPNLEHWRKMVGHVALHKSLFSTQTLEWLLITWHIMLALPRQQIRPKTLQMIHECLVKLARMLPDDAAVRIVDDDANLVAF